MKHNTGKLPSACRKYLLDRRDVIWAGDRFTYLLPAMDEYYDRTSTAGAYDADRASSISGSDDEAGLVRKLSKGAESIFRSKSKPDTDYEDLDEDIKLSDFGDADRLENDIMEEGNIPCLSCDDVGINLVLRESVSPGDDSSSCIIPTIYDAADSNSISFPAGHGEMTC